jgi:hypothetical protein
VRLSDLLRCTVHDQDGHELGRVTDVRIVQDGPIVAGLQAAFRVDALVVGRGGLADRLGYVRARVRGPWLLRALFTRLEQQAQIVAAQDVVSWDISSGIVHVRPQSV